MSAPDDPPDRRSKRARLRDGYFAVMRGFMLTISGIVGVFSLFMAAAAALDLLFKFGWDAPWTTIPGGLAMAIGAYCFYWLSSRILDAVHFVGK